jgi:hypothetical protein
MRASAAPLALAVALACPALALGQVGHPPQSSPYSDLAKGNSITFVGGRFMGDGGRVGVGPNSGYTFGLRYDLRASRALALGLGVERGNLERLIVNPFDAVGQQVSGPVDQKVTFVEAFITLNLTGGKTWHGFAPFTGVVTGAAFATSTPADTTGYNFGKKFFFGPAAGFRMFLGNRLHLRAEARASFWKLSYPPSFHAGITPITADVSEWNLTPWFVVGLGFIM